MEAQITSFRRSRRVMKGNQMILKLPDVDKRSEATKLIGKKVVWKSPAGKEIKGEIVSAHGNKGCVRAMFEKGMPGQAVFNKIKVE